MVLLCLAAALIPSSSVRGELTIYYYISDFGSFGISFGGLSPE